MLDPTYSNPNDPAWLKFLVGGWAGGWVNEGGQHEVVERSTITHVSRGTRQVCIKQRFGWVDWETMDGAGVHFLRLLVCTVFALRVFHASAWPVHGPLSPVPVRSASLLPLISTPSHASPSLPTACLPAPTQDAFNEFSLSHGAILSISQTRRAQPSQVHPISQGLAAPRFTSQFMGQFVQ